MAMTEVLFYHFSGTPPAEFLPKLLEKTLERGWRAVVRVQSYERVRMLDEYLWVYDEESFLPHGADAAVPEVPDRYARQQPVWITAGDDMPNMPQVMFLPDGVPAVPEPVRNLERLVVIVDDRENSLIHSYREFLKQEGHTVTSWSRGSGAGWEKKEIPCAGAGQQV